MLLKKIISVPKAVFNYLTGKESLNTKPVFIQVEPSSICNLRCAKCIQTKNDWDKGLMDFDFFKEIIDKISQFNSEAGVGIYGLGESLIHPRLIDMIKYAKTKGLKVTIHTNATLLTPKFSEEIIESKLDSLIFSVDGYEKEIYERLHEGGKFEEVVENIKQFLQIKLKKKSKIPYTEIQSIEYGELMNDLGIKVKRERFKNLFKGLSLNNFELIFYHNWGGKVKEFKKEKRKYTICTFPWYYLFVRYNGDVIPCAMDCYSQYKLGNLKEKSFGEIWNSEKMMNLRNKLHQKKYFELLICKNCDKIWKKHYFEPTSANFRLYKKFLRLWLKK